jgi:hypothetical protein
MSDCLGTLRAIIIDADEVSSNQVRFVFAVVIVSLFGALLLLYVLV